MRKVLVSLLLVSASSFGEILWNPDTISFALVQAHPALGKGLVLELNQKLEPGQSGWKQSRIDVPESWESAKVSMYKGSIQIQIDKYIFYLNASNKGALSFAILNGGTKTDQQLLEIWLEHAANT